MIKRLSLAFMVIMLLLYGCGGGSSSSDGGSTPPSVCGTGTGTAKDPVVICTAEELDAIRDNLSLSYVLNADVGLVEPWTPVGTRATPFTGSFDGGGHTISGLKMDEYDYVGLFGYLSGASVSNLTLDLAAEGIDGNNYVGGVAGRADNSTIYAVSVHGHIEGKNDTGGIAGRSVGSVIEYSYTTGTMNAAGVSGGIAGSLDRNAVITDCYSTVDVRSRNYAGGIAGQVINSTVMRTYSTGAVENTDTASSRVGGIIGRADSSTVTANVALNTRLSAQRLVNRIAGEALDCDLADNYAVYMPIWGTQTGGEAGIDITSAEASSRDFYSSIGWQFGSSSWNLTSTAYPELFH